MSKNSQNKKTTPRRTPKTIHFRGRTENVLETIRVGGRQLFAIEKMSGRGAFRVFDPRASPGGDYRILYRIPAAQITRQKTEVLNRIAGPNANRNFPHIVDCLRQGQEYFLVMSWVWGTNLREFNEAIRARKIPRPTVPEIVRLFRGLAHGVSHYHRRANIVHGDISPRNIILTSGTRNLVLVDFGSAWPIENSYDKKDGDGVSPPYAAPERIFGHAVQDLRSDLFSLSAVAYELLTGEIPFDGLGGLAGQPDITASQTPSLTAPSRMIFKADKLPANATSQLDEHFRIGLGLHPGDRFATRESWLASWDALHLAMQKGGRMSEMERAILAGIERVAQFFRKRRGNEEDNRA